MTNRQETKEEQIRREMDEAEKHMAIAAWKRQLILTILTTIWTAVIVFIIVMIIRTP